MKPLYIFLLFFPFLIHGTNLTTQVRGNDMQSLEHPWKQFKFDGSSELEVEGAIPLSSNFSLWGNSTPSKKKDFLEECEQIRSISFGIKYALPFTQSLFPYIGAGANFSNLQKIDYSTIKKRIKSHDFEYVGKSGVLFFMTSHLFVDLFADYYFSEHSSLQNLKFNGILKTGLGLGIGF